MSRVAEVELREDISLNSGIVELRGDIPFWAVVEAELRYYITSRAELQNFVKTLLIRDCGSGIRETFPSEQICLLSHYNSFRAKLR